MNEVFALLDLYTTLKAGYVTTRKVREEVLDAAGDLMDTLSVAEQRFILSIFVWTDYYEKPVL